MCNFIKIHSKKKTGMRFIKWSKDLPFFWWIQKGKIEKEEQHELLVQKHFLILLEWNLNILRTFLHPLLVQVWYHPKIFEKELTTLIINFLQIEAKCKNLYFFFISEKMLSWIWKINIVDEKKRLCLWRIKICSIWICNFLFFFKKK